MKPSKGTGKKQPSHPGSAWKNPARPKLPPSLVRWPLTPVICLTLAAITWIVFGQTIGFDFVNYDDSFYVYQNPAIKNGLTRSGLVTAFTHPLVGNWHPLTSLSLMLDAQFFGLNAGGYHLVNVLLHTIAVLLLFLVLRTMTGAVWRSAFVAVLFAIHPLRAESVVWISERKDVLSAVFFLVAIWCYCRYARRPSVSAYLMVAVALTLGLLAKAMLVSLPFVLLLLDFWPLQRFALPQSESGSDLVQRRSAAWLILEKLPLLFLACAASVATVFAQERGLEAGAQWGFLSRIENALVTIWVYLRQLVWPSGLAVFYPHPQGSVPLWETGLSLVLLLVVSAVVLIWCKRYPYLVTGWFWYLGMLVPVIGLVQVGWQAHADRYTYLPQIGIYLLIAWGAADLTSTWRARRLLVGGAAIIVIVAFMTVAWMQTGYWSSSVPLWTHALEVTTNNNIAERGLGTALLKLGQVEQAIAHQREALRIRPGDPNALTNLANALSQNKEWPEAIERYREVVRLRPNDNEMHRNLGKALFQSGAIDESMGEFREALRIRSDDSDASYSLGNALLQKGEIPGAISYFRRAISSDHSNLGAPYNLAIALQRNGQLDEAIAEFRQTIRLRPQYADAHNNLAIALLKKGQTQEAIAEWRETLRLQPDKIGTQISLAWILATSPEAAIRDGTKALDFVQRADQTSGGRNLMTFRVLAAAYAEAGRFPEAINAAQEGEQRAAAQGQTSVARLLEGDLALYKQGVALRESATVP
jgi:tetratricopeptide (TPR) repeat protein